jgi:hypothetical protein
MEIGKQETEIIDYVWQFLYSETLTEASENVLTNLSDSIFSFAEKLKIRQMKKGYIFSDEDWFELKEIIDKFQ